MGKNHALRRNDMGGVRLQHFGKAMVKTSSTCTTDMTWEKRLESEEAFTDEIPFNSDNDTEQQ